MSGPLALAIYMLARQQLDEAAFAQRFPTPVLVRQPERRTSTSSREHRMTQAIVTAHLEVFALPSGYATRAEGIKVGRGADNGVQIAAATVSKYHAIISSTAENCGFSITDVGSTNGTHLRGVRLAAHQPTLLPDGASLSLGTLSLRFCTPGVFYRWLDAWSRPASVSTTQTLRG